MDPDLSIVLLGNSGAGKSSSGNTILGRAAFESRLSLRRVTTEICEATGRVFGRQIRVMDTPGILASEQQIKTLCQTLLRSCRPVLFLVVLRVGRFTTEEQDAVEAAMRVLGPQGRKKSYLLFTGGDALKDMTLTDFIFGQENSSLPDVVQKFEKAYHLFNNEGKDQEQVRKLLLKSGLLKTEPEEPEEPGEPGEPGEPELRIVLVGKTGAGKSLSGNTILRTKVFQSKASSSLLTSQCQKETSKIDGQTLTVVDTPGLCDTGRPQDEVKKDLVTSVSLAAPGPHAFLVVIHPNRFTEEERRTVKIIQNVFGKEAEDLTMVLFTHGDDLEADGVSIEEYIGQNETFRDFLRQCRGGHHVFNNRDDDPSQVRELLEKINAMVQRNGRSYYTNEMLQEAERATKEETGRLQRKAEEDGWFPWRLLCAVCVRGAEAGAAAGPVGAVAGAAVGATGFAVALVVQQKACVIQ